MLYSVTGTRETRHMTEAGIDTIVWFSATQLPTFQVEATSLLEAKRKALAITSAERSTVRLDVQEI